jgi:hypothetical protein
VHRLWRWVCVAAADTLGDFARIHPSWYERSLSHISSSNVSTPLELLPNTISDLLLGMREVSPMYRLQACRLPSPHSLQKIGSTNLVKWGGGVWERESAIVRDHPELDNNVRPRMHVIYESCQMGWGGVWERGVSHCERSPGAGQQCTPANVFRVPRAVVYHHTDQPHRRHGPRGRLCSGSCPIYHTNAQNHRPPCTLSRATAQTEHTDAMQARDALVRSVWWGQPYVSAQDVKSPIVCDAVRVL